jgi:hypothetical protein
MLGLSLNSLVCVFGSAEFLFGREGLAGLHGRRLLHGHVQRARPKVDQDGNEVVRNTPHESSR